MKEILPASEQDSTGFHAKPGRYLRARIQPHRLGQMLRRLGMTRLESPRMSCRVRMLPPFWMKWLAVVCREEWAACPFGRRMVVLASAQVATTN